MHTPQNLRNIILILNLQFNLFGSRWQIQARDQDEEGTRANRRCMMVSAKKYWDAQVFGCCFTFIRNSYDILKIRWYEKLTGKSKLILFWPLVFSGNFKQVKNVYTWITSYSLVCTELGVMILLLPTNRLHN